MCSVRIARQRGARIEPYDKPIDGGRYNLCRPWSRAIGVGGVGYHLRTTHFVLLIILQHYNVFAVVVAVVVAIVVVRW